MIHSSVIVEIDSVVEDDERVAGEQMGDVGG